MTDIRIYYLQYEEIEKTVNSTSFDAKNVPAILDRLKSLMASGNELDTRFIALNKDYLYPTELAGENELRNAKALLLYSRLARKK